MPDRPIPYGRQLIGPEDIEGVVEALRSDWLTQGPAVSRFEGALATYCGARHAVAVANGTAALHLAALAAGFGTGTEAVTTPLTFAASANCVLYAGGTPVFADIDPDTLCLDPARARERVTPATRGIIPVHFGGRPCDMPAFAALARERGLTVIEDAAHALGATYAEGDRVHRVGSCAHSDMTIFSFHPVKHVTTGEGGAITTNDESLCRKLLLLRSHGITRDPSLLSRQEGPWYYEMQELGFNYRITDIQCALGATQLAKADRFLARRRAIAAAYHRAFQGEPELILPPSGDGGGESAWHLYVLQFRTLDRRAAFEALRAEGLGVNVHYIPVHLQPYYVRRFGDRRGSCPAAERYYERAVTIPLHHGMTEEEVERVIRAVLKVARGGL